ncbi:MAG: hypothetical protein FWD67_04945 [Betaproteobacteria bacterium]|nr:hypothetical protein [Betaproteobacteria bacterium]
MVLAGGRAFLVRRVPTGSVVVPGFLPPADGKYSLYCVAAVKKTDAQAWVKTSINGFSARLISAPE